MVAETERTSDSLKPKANLEEDSFSRVYADLTGAGLHTQDPDHTNTFDWHPFDPHPVARDSLPESELLNEEELDLHAFSGPESEEQPSAGIDQSRPERIIQTLPYQKWREPIQNLAGLWGPILNDLVRGAINRMQAEARMILALEDYLSGNCVPADRAMTFAGSIKRILQLHNKIAADIESESKTASEILMDLRRLRRGNSVERRHRDSGVYPTFANLVYDVHIASLKRAISD